MNKKLIKLIPTIIVLTAIIITLYPYRHFPSYVMNELLDENLPLVKHTTAIFTYDKEDALITKIEEMPSSRIIEITLSSDKLGSLQHNVQKNNYDYYKVGKVISVYISPYVGDTYVFDIETQISLLLQIGIFFFFVFMVMRFISSLGNRKIAILTFGYLYIFKPLCYTPAVILLIYTNIEVQDSVMSNSNDSSRVIFMHIISAILMIIYIYDMYKLFHYYKKAKHLVYLDSLKSPEETKTN
ncbi:hypothetical protein [Myroides sp. N17-2]|uniref:hypothetical protein n=1 Tax=Myroides sp. N17-2 TaxID=2030799 RepID=UPI00117E1DAF|nr:hypothetical protein [Myroides sp. N17-2]